jgi:hypothetical protein
MSDFLQKQNSASGIVVGVRGGRMMAFVVDRRNEAPNPPADEDAVLAVQVLVETYKWEKIARTQPCIGALATQASWNFAQ